MAPFKFIQCEEILDGRVAIITLDRPRAMNALNGDLLDEVELALDRLQEKDMLATLIFTGSGGNFSAGADLKEEGFEQVERIRRMHRLVLRLRDFPAATIAAIEGWALGGGLELAMACTFRTAAPDARLGLPEIRLGAIPSYGGTQLARMLLGPAKALELICTGEPVDAEKAARIGLVNWVASADGTALAVAVDRATQLAEFSVPALAAARQAVLHGADLSLEDALALELKESLSAVERQAPDGIARFRKRSKTPT